MEKRIPHYALAEAKALLRKGEVRMTQKAKEGATELGLEVFDILAVVLALTPKDFHKSMTSYADHRIWQDVYRPESCMGAVYLKLTVLDQLLIVSFKEL